MPSLDQPFQEFWRQLWIFFENEHTCVFVCHYSAPGNMSATWFDTIYLHLLLLNKQPNYQYKTIQPAISTIAPPTVKALPCHANHIPNLWVRLFRACRPSKSTIYSSLSPDNATFHPAQSESQTGERAFYIFFCKLFNPIKSWSSGNTLKFGWSPYR